MQRRGYAEEMVGLRFRLLDRFRSAPPIHFIPYNFHLCRRRLTFHRHSGCRRPVALERGLARAQIDPFVPVLPMHRPLRFLPRKLLL